MQSNSDFTGMESELDLASQYEFGSIARKGKSEGKNNRKVSNSAKRKKKRRQQKASRKNNR